ncbi:uncharacterized protein LOC129601824 [Paramacrobiotus metropolitanus]|uniref:uncharacterized protein LOC129601824 n=1 Tax=Paramacrobiotus metropolitanus TaxID=2943436 RepID=UPI00244640AF|nr:uncharacterized protein LOC129601824 [Paramacrobiotus metropolitanus]
MMGYEICALIVFIAICCRVSTKTYRNLPENWRDFIDPEILANSDDDEYTRYDSDLPEGDILGLQTMQLGQEAANAVSDASSFWPNNTIPFEFSKKQNALMTPKELQIVLESMRIINHLTGNCVKFVQRTTEEDYISFQKGLQCMSNIGRIGGKQVVTYSPACLKQHGDVQHELMHVLGFFHEHSRADRDEYVKIIWDNIAKSDRDQFAKHENGNTYGLPYDYESVMHYKHNAFAKDSGIPTIVPTSRKSKIGQNRDLSPLDVVRIHRRFRCAIAHPKQFACDSSGNEKPGSCPVCPLAQTRKEDPCDSGKRIEDEGENDEMFTASESFPQFSQEPMTAEQCGHQFTANCNQPGLTVETCTSFQGLTINCSRPVSSTEIRQISAGLSRSPKRAIAVDLYDGDYIVFENFQNVRQQVVAIAIRNCISSRTVQKLAALRFSNLLELEIIHCTGLEIKRTDFSLSNKITVITFEDTTIKRLERGTFTDLPSLRVLSLELGMRNRAVFGRSIRDYLKKLHCGCEFGWFRDWWDNNRQLLRKAALGEVYFIPQAWRNVNYTKEDIYSPIDCSVNPFPAEPASVDHKQYRFSINVPNFSSADVGTSQCSDEIPNSKVRFPDFSSNPMTPEECNIQFTTNCEPTFYTRSECLLNKLVQISCNEEASSDEIIRMLKAVNKAPLRPLLINSVDNSELSSADLGEVRRQIVAYNLHDCTDRRVTGRLREMPMPSLLEYHLYRCLSLHAKKADFEYSQKLRIVAFFNSTFRTIESDTFSQLPALRILSLEAEIRKAVTFNANIKDYLFRLHCSCDFAPFRKWRQNNKQLLRMAEKRQLYSFQDSYSSSAFQPSDVYVPIDCSADPFPSGPDLIDFDQVEFSLNEPSC